jgi:hypothetical protein
MDDPWGNAWEEPTTDRNPPTWTHTTIHPDVPEGDIGITTSWSAVNGIKWGEDEHASRSSTLWTQSNESLQVWSSQHEHLPPEEKSPVIEPPQVLAIVPVDDAEASSPSSDKENTQLPSPTLSLPPRISSSPPKSSDPFGGFESGNPTSTKTSDPEVWTSATYPPAEDADAWGSTAWGDIETKTEQKDEWEAVRTIQDKEGRQVVRCCYFFFRAFHANNCILQHSELLASILSQWEELAAQVWCETGRPTEEPAWMSQAMSGIQGLECLLVIFALYQMCHAPMNIFTSKPALEKLTAPPGMVLPPATQFTNSHVRRKMVEALKSTRNLPFTKDSPMAFFLASKGSLAWEATVKSKKDVVDDGSNLLPAGWKIVDKDRGKDTAHAMSDANKGRKSSGLLSFWGRRVSKPPEMEEKSNPSPAASRPSTPKIAADVSAPTSNKEATAKPPSDGSLSPSPMAITKSTPTPPQVPKPKPPSPLPDSSTTPTAANQNTDTNPQPEAKPSTSTVSRWFSRFTTKGPTPRDSLALSSNDLEFLSDIRSGVDEAGQALKDSQMLDLGSNDSEASLANLSSESVPPPPPPKISGNATTASSSGGIFDLFGWNGSYTTTSSSEPPSVDESLFSVNVSLTIFLGGIF